MKLICALFLLFFTVGCTATKSLVTEYGADGKVVKVTETTESVISSVTASTKDKTVIAWEDGWTAYISASSGTTEDPTPHGKIYVGKVNKGAISLHKNHNDVKGLADIIMSTKSDLKVNMTGAESASSK